MSVPYLLSRSLLIPSFLTSVPGTLDFLSPIVQSGHSLQPCFPLGIEYGIDVGSLVLESPWFWYSFTNFSVNYSIIKKQRPKGNASHDSPIDWRNYEWTSSFTSKFDNHIFYDLSPFSLAVMKWMHGWWCMNADLEFSPKTLLKIKEPFHWSHKDYTLFNMLQLYP